MSTSEHRPSPGGATTGAGKSLAAKLAEPGRYLEQLVRFEARHGGTRRARSLQAGGVSMASLLRDREEVARRVAHAVARRDYWPSPAPVRRVQAGKSREVFAFDAIDLLVHGTVAAVINEAAEPRMAGGVYSYRRGRSSWDATAAFVAHLGVHRRGRVVAERGLHVFRADIENFGPSIPNHDQSALWARLAELLSPADDAEDRWAWSLVRAVIRPEVAHDDGRVEPLARGMPTGSPAGTAAQNWFLHPLDRQLEDLVTDAGEGGNAGFYARYGDDLLVAHPSLAVVDRARELAEAWLGAEGMRAHPDKQLTVFLNGAGRPSGESGGPSGATHLRYLGVEIGFDGTTRLPRDKQRSFLVELRARLRRSAGLVAGAPLEERGRGLVGIVNAMLLAPPPLSGPHMDWMLRRVTDRGQLAALDREIALALVAVLVGRRGVRGFRAVPWHQLRRWGLVSLVDLRNRGRRRVL